MSAKLLKSFRHVVVGAFLVAGCSGGEPIPVNLETAKGPCDYGQQFMTEGMRMVMKDGQLTVVSKEEGGVQAMELLDTEMTMETGCEGCH
jgi:hypothetical protein